MRGPTPSELILASFNAIARVLAVRFLMLLSIIGFFVLAEGALAAGTNATLAVLIAYGCLTVVPLVVLEFLGRPR